MSSDWELKKLNEVAEIVGGGTPSTKNDKYWDGPISWITPKDLSSHEGVYIKGGERSLTEEGLNNSSTKLLPKGSLLISSRAPIGYLAIADSPLTTNQGFRSLVFKEGNISEFFYYLIKGNIPLLESRASGSTFKEISGSSLAEIEFRIPDYDTQNKIAYVLKTFDQKIHINQQTNETLEAMAQAIFKSWFVDFDPVRAKIKATSAGRDPNRAAMAAIAGISLDPTSPAGRQDWDEIEAALDQKLTRMSEAQQEQLSRTAELFPDELVESEIGEVPKGWDYSTIGKEFDIVNGQSPPGSSYNEEGQGAPFYQGRTDFGFRFPTQRVYCTEPKRFAKKGDTLLSVRAPVGDLNIAIEDCCIGRGLASLRHKSGSTSYTYYAMKQVQVQIEVYEATGTVFGSINQKQLKALDTISPDEKIINEFHRIAEPIDGQIMNQVFMNRELSELRDTLLPKLISGEITTQTIKS